MYSLSKIVKIYVLIQLKYGSYNSTKVFFGGGRGGCLLRSFPPPYFEFGRKQSISSCYLDGFYGFWWVHKNSIWYPIKILIFLEFPQLPHPPTPTLLKSFTFNIWLSPKNYIFYDPKVCYIRHCSEIEKASCRDFYPPPLMILTSLPMIIPQWSI